MVGVRIWRQGNVSCTDNCNGFMGLCYVELVFHYGLISALSVWFNILLAFGWDRGVSKPGIKLKPKLL